MAAAGGPRRSDPPAPGAPRWLVLGVVVGGFLLLIGLAAWVVPSVGVSDVAAEALTFAGVAFALVIVLAFLLRPAPRAVAAPTESPRPAPPLAPAPVQPEVAAVSEEPPAAAPVPAAPDPSFAELSATNAVRRAAAVSGLAAGPPTLAIATPMDDTSLSSIPGAYLQALGTPRDPTTPWSEAAPPIAASLPFAAGVQRLPPEPASPSETTAPVHASFLELELARLRARVRELEGPRAPSSSAPGTRQTPGPTGAPTPTAKGPEPPAPPVRTTFIARGCFSCGNSIGTNQGPLLCWGCGRPLCTACYWRYGPGPGLHRCPECRANAPAPAISGGRAGRFSGPSPGASAAATNSPAGH